MRIHRTIVIALALALAIPAAAPASAATQNPDARDTLSARLAVAAKRLGVSAAVGERRSTVRTAHAAASLSTWTVGVSRGAAPSVARAIVAEGGTVKRASRSGDSLSVSFAPGTEGTRVAITKRMAGVRYVQRSASLRATALPSDPDLAAQWAITQTGADRAWNTAAADGAGVKIAVLDTGLDYANPQFAGRIDTTNAFDFIGRNALPSDDHGHGTFVAGVAAAAADGTGTVGVAPAATILPLKVLDDSGDGDDFTIAEAIRWAADADADVINMSLGGGGATQVLADAVRYAQDAGAIVVAAAGNEGNDNDVSYPAALPGVVGVGASTRNDTVADFSCTGPDVDLVAPGVEIASCGIDGVRTDTAAGTSAAAPQVAAAAALLLSRSPDLTAEEVAAKLASSAVDIERPGRDVASGAGRLDVAAALDLAPTTLTHVQPGSSADAPGASAMPLDHTSAIVDDELGGIGNDVDAYAIPIRRGETIEASITTSPDLEVSLWGFRPNARSVNSDRTLAWTEPAPGRPGSILMTACQDGTVTVAVSRWEGTGSYKLGFTRLSSDAPADRKLPGALPTTSPVTGYADSRGDLLVYRFNLAKGQRLATKLTTGGSLTALYGPNAFSPDLLGLITGDTGDGSDDPVAAAANLPQLEWGNDDSIEYVAPESGEYTLLSLCIDARSLRGSWYGSSMPYQLRWTVSEPTAEETIPGLALRPSADATSGIVTGAIERPFSPRRVYNVDLKQGERLTLCLSSPATSTGDLDVAVLAPGSTDPVRSTRLAESSNETAITRTEALNYVAPIDGVYYVLADAYFGAAPYEMSWRVGEAVRPAVEASIDTTRPAYGRPVSIEATFTAGDGTPMADLAYRVESMGTDPWVDDMGWSTRKTGLTPADGHVRVTLPTRWALIYRIAAYDGRTRVAYKDFRVMPGVSLTAPKASTNRPVRSRGFKVSGVLRPGTFWTSRVVRVRAYHLEGSKWVPRVTVWARTSDLYDSYSSYSASLRLTRAGRWKLVAEHPATSQNGAGVSKPTYITVR